MGEQEDGRDSTLCLA